MTNVTMVTRWESIWLRAASEVAYVPRVGNECAGNTIARRGENRNGGRLYPRGQGGTDRADAPVGLGRF